MYSAGLTMKLEIPHLLPNIFQGSIIIETIGRVSKLLELSPPRGLMRLSVHTLYAPLAKDSLYLIRLHLFFYYYT